MKNILNLRILSIFIASAILFSCSKENLYPVQTSEPAGAAKMVPMYTYGAMAGTLNPAPFYAALKFYNDDENFVTSCFADLDGHFKITGLLPGIYRVMVKYVRNRPGPFPNEEYNYFEIRGIIVETGILTQLGEIKLPE